MAVFVFDIIYCIAFFTFFPPKCAAEIFDLSEKEWNFYASSGRNISAKSAKVCRCSKKKNIGKI
jgi:hypothetical protein